MAEEILYIKANLDDINKRLDELDKRLGKVSDDGKKAGKGLEKGMKKADVAAKKPANH